MGRAKRWHAKRGCQAARAAVAGGGALTGGDLTGGDAVAEQAAPRLVQPLARARAQRVHGVCLQAQGRTAEAVRTLADAALEAGPADPGLARDAMLEAFSAAQLDAWF